MSSNVEISLYVDSTMKLLQKISGIIAAKMPATPEIIIQSKGRFNNSSSDGTMPSKDAAYYRSFKSSLKKRLVNSLMLISIDADEVSNTDAAITFPLYMQVIGLMHG